MTRAAVPQLVGDVLVAAGERHRMVGDRSDLVGVVDNPELYAAGKEFKQLISSGDVDIKRQDAEVVEADDEVAY